jgi:hypothetical protein
MHPQLDCTRNLFLLADTAAADFGRGAKPGQNGNSNGIEGHPRRA